MSKTLQFRRGTTSELSAIAGAIGELFVDTTKDTVVVMDGSTAGGFPLQKELLSGTNIKTVNGQSVLGSGDITISSGSGSSFDQELNTTNDVVFNGALLGNVAIVDNTITATDSYGNPDTLIVDGDLNVNGEFTINGQPISGTSFSGSYNDLTNIPAFKTINGQTIIGSGDLVISGGTSGSYNDLTDIPTFKTINGQTIIGSGNLVISGGTSGGSLDFGTFTSPAGFTLDMGIF